MTLHVVHAIDALALVLAGAECRRECVAVVVRALERATRSAEPSGEAPA